MAMKENDVPDEVVGRSDLLDAVTDNWPDTDWGWANFGTKYGITGIVIDRIPDGWAKVEGEWIRLRPRTPDNSAGRRLYEEA